MAEESLLQQAFAGAGEQLDRIIDAYERKKDTKQYFRIRNNPDAAIAFSIQTPYPIANRNPVTGTLNGSPRNGYICNGYAVYTVPEPTEQEQYIGEFILSEEAPIVWFDSATSTTYPGIHEVIEE